ncbi:uncharacterized protein NDAI_0K02990 [Naumovozyma dairenensis CBS 421]|uniref:L-lactate dehydrogenase (cytochrome) n=1 Tax=Naumovozyma dairenensis (strain ATCC 10597 / BCRC 20456 / CBS 421 / NBRC 0211 / NRRL Y-12639) TaxID=1071378 RepID=G0WI79_NAUDC|nr:hypothetical protein NDAI_0K02990 [Naumovozyma dairenensis CBS 421]CCD27490.1 hypothetical protein NDAI_0K02990 [Naumovozyma dairenensis CBS 421]
MSSSIQLPPIESVFNLNDFEKIAAKVLPEQVYAYYSSSADDEVSYRENHNSFHKIFFKPKILVDVTNIDLTTEILDSQVDIPFYVSATALCGLGNPKGGELDIVKGCADVNVPHMISTFSSFSIEEIAEAKINENQIQWLQLYVNSDRKITHDLIVKAERLGMKALFVTVDAPSAGNRERDARFKFSAAENNGPKVMEKSKDKDATTNGTSRTLSKLIDTSLTWADIETFKKLTNMPIVLKGVQRVDDAIRAAEIGCRGVVLSNHGGRELDFSRPPLEVLAELMPVLRDRGLNKNFDVLIDGGIRRGTDILKALCLGAKGVGIAAPFLYANSLYGSEGVELCTQLLIKELVLSMRLLGVTKLSDLNADFLDLSGLFARAITIPRTTVYHDSLA